MKKVFIVHGFLGTPNGGWRPWLMGELEKHDVYACSIALPTPEKPILAEWIAEIARHVEQNPIDEIYLVGHSLGSPAIMRYLESPDAKLVAGVVLASSPCASLGRAELDEFIAAPFDFALIKSNMGNCAIIHGDNDDRVPFAHAEILAKEFDAELISVPNGGHLNGKSGWHSLPHALEALKGMMK